VPLNSFPLLSGYANTFPSKNGNENCQPTSKKKMAKWQKAASLTTATEN